MKKPLHPLFRSVTTLALLTGCLQAPEEPLPLEALTVEALTAQGPLGNETPLLDLTRRPTLTLITNVPLNSSGPPLFLFDGALDAATLQDLTAPPLRIATQARLLDARVELQGTQAKIAPDLPLQPQQQLTLVLAPWAVGESGQRFPKDTKAFVAPLQVTSQPAGGAAIVGSWPANGASGVPPNLAYAAIAADGALSAVTDSLSLDREDGRDSVPVTVQPAECEDLGFRAYTCLKLIPERDLLAGTAYLLRVEDWTDQAGARLDPWSARFVTAAEADHQAPTTLAVPCALDEIDLIVGCALITDTSARLRLAADEPTLITWTADDCIRRTIAAFGGEADFTLEHLTPDHEHTLHVSLLDAAGNTTHWEAPFVTTPTLAPVTISEVRFDPVGPEPQQEYVELFNFGRVPVDLLGYALRDDPLRSGDTIARSVILHPGGRVLLVADDFDSANPLDVAPAPGVLLVRMGTSLGSGGLSNSGEAVFLVDDNGTRLSETPAVASAGAGSCLQRRQPDTRDGRIESFVHDADRPCTPGW